MLRQVILGLLCSMSIVVHAAVSCVPVNAKVDSKNIVLSAPIKPSTSQLYFINNKAQHGVWLDHPQAKKSASAGWSSYIQAGHWSAFLLSGKDFVLSCAVIQPGKVDYQPCADVVSICVANNANFKTSPKNSYWLAEDKSWNDIVKAVQKRGVDFK